MRARKTIVAASRPALHWRSQGSSARAAARKPFSVVETGLDLAKLLVAGGVLGAGIGLLVLSAYGFKRDALPMFNGDEWVPQLVALGFFCGLMVGILSAVPWLDARVDRSFVVVRPSDARAGRIAQFLLQVVIGSALLACVAFVKLPGLQLWVLVGLWLASVALKSEVSSVWGGQRYPDKGIGHAELLLLIVTGQLFYLATLFVVWILAYQRTLGTADSTAWWPAILATVCFALYRSAFVALDKAPAVARFYAAILVVVVMGWYFSPEIVRMAGLGNLPNARISVDAATACELVDHLELTAPALADPCKSAWSGGAGLVYLDVDIVSRFGGQVVLAAPGSLLQTDDGKCKALLRKPRASPSSFRCVEIPRDSVKALSR